MLFCPMRDDTDCKSPIRSVRRLAQRRTHPARIDIPELAASVNHRGMAYAEAAIRDPALRTPGPSDLSEPADRQYRRGGVPNNAQRSPAQNCAVEEPSLWRADNEQIASCLRGKCNDLLGRITVLHQLADIAP